MANEIVSFNDVNMLSVIKYKISISFLYVPWFKCNFDIINMGTLLAFN